MKIEAYQCQYCQLVHMDKTDWQKCETKCKTEEAKKLKRAEAEKEIQTLFDYPRLNATSLEDLSTLCQDIAKKVWGTTVTIKFINMVYTDLISNSHSAPLNGVTNWSRVKNKAQGYPGFTGTIKIVQSDTRRTKGLSRFSAQEVPKGSEIFENRGINGVSTGTGGGGSGNSYSYEVRLFLSDFTKFGALRKEALVVKKDYDKAKQKQESLILKALHEDKQFKELESQRVALQEQIQVLVNKRDELVDARQKRASSVVEPFEKEIQRLEKAKDKIFKERLSMFASII